MKVYLVADSLRTIVLELCLGVLYLTQPFLLTLFELNEDAFKLHLVSLERTIVFLELFVRGLLYASAQAVLHEQVECLTHRRLPEMLPFELNFLESFPPLLQIR